MVPTTKHRRGRRTRRQEAALAGASPYFLGSRDLLDGDTQEGVDLAPAFARGRPVILDVGFGTGEVVVAYAEAEPDREILAIDMHTPGIGDLLATIGEQGLDNVWVIDDDVRRVLSQVDAPREFSGARTFFPDPWPKKRHHRRRLIQDDFISLLGDHIASGGFWHVATDWVEYANGIEQAVARCDSWRGGRIPRPEDRPVTRYERRGLAAGRVPIDLWFERA